MSRIFTYVIASLFFLNPLFVLAQGIPGVTDTVDFTLVPQYPKPNEAVYIRAQSFNTNLNKAEFAWTVNGKPVAEGLGVKEIRVVTGAPGTATEVGVIIKTIDIGIISDTVFMYPAEVNLVWEADTYTPPFYKGKALHSYNGAFKVTAIPEFFDRNNKRIDPKDLIYNWKKNDVVQNDASGYGKDSFVSSQTSYLREGEEITVEVSSSREDLTASNKITITPTTPKILFYEKSPLFGTLYGKKLNQSFKLTNEEITLVAVPMFFSAPKAMNSNLALSWVMNGSPVSEFENKNEITLRREDDNAGRSNISVTAQHNKRVLQGASGSISISFDKK